MSSHLSCKKVQAKQDSSAEFKAELSESEVWAATSAARNMQAKQDSLAEFKVELSESQEWAATSAARKVQTKQDSFIFKKKSHKEQHKANTKIDEALLKAEMELESVPSDMTAASAVKDALVSGRSY